MGLTTLMSKLVATGIDYIDQYQCWSVCQSLSGDTVLKIQDETSKPNTVKTYSYVIVELSSNTKCFDKDSFWQLNSTVTYC